MRSLLPLLLVLFFCGTLLGAVVEAGPLKDELPLQKITEILESASIKVSRWEVVARETFPQEDADKMRELLESQFPDADWKHTSDRNSDKFYLSHPQKQEGITENVIMIVPKNDHLGLEIIYKIHGKQWDEQMSRFVAAAVKEKNNRIFSKNVVNFSCAEAEISGIMNDVLVYEILDQALNIKPVETIEEADFTSISGYTEKWGQKIPLPAGPMNVQFAAREGLGAKTTITIGTPIITSEY
ncbi:YwmB family TATA-box binding protein [Thalassobacillus pellis]|uniref:YwmB family TATA-box binding protein n=1 Tax=Thalassobacillus pellis TaxID=748008 RepID=UPI001960AA52|nr:YwmB family TATA-box binding protein [Thalassobacillus pellis]MBM7551745.1 hypothetical protein [Thalassobacillus pellis]